MKIKFEATVRVNKSVEYYEISDKYSVFRYKVRNSIIDSTQHNSTFSEFSEFGATVDVVGITYNTMIQQFIEGKSNRLVGEWNLIFVKQDFIDSLRDNGYVQTMENFNDELEKVRKNLMKIYKDPEYQLVLDYHEGHMVFDMNDVPFAMGIKFDYINGDITNEKYDLPAVVKSMTQNKQVSPLRSSSFMREIPYYNATDTCTDAVEFMFTPTQEQMCEIWKAANKINRNYPTTALVEAVISLDLVKISQYKK